MPTGVGSRYFFVLNSQSGAQAVSAASPAPALALRQARDSASQPGIAAPVAASPTPLRLRELERLELALPLRSAGTTWSGVLDLNGVAQALPAGSTLDGAAGVFSLAARAGVPRRLCAAVYAVGRFCAGPPVGAGPVICQPLLS